MRNLLMHKRWRCFVCSAEKLEIRSTGRLWGDVVTVAFSTEEGSFLRGQVRMEDELDLGLDPLIEPPSADEPIFDEEEE